MQRRGVKEAIYVNREIPSLNRDGFPVLSYRPFPRIQGGESCGKWIVGSWKTFLLSPKRLPLFWLTGGQAQDLSSVESLA